MKNYQRIICISLSFILILLYVKFCIGQYTEMFYEAQFLHVGFIKDLVAGVYHAQNFFTTFGEHLFPGYNVLLFVNYKLFGITSMFELVCSVLASLGIAFILCLAAAKEKRCWWLPILIFAIVLSPVQNIMWGMALAAHISTLILVLITYLIYFRKPKFSELFCLSILIPIYVIFFSGAYAVGFVAVIISVCVFSSLKNDKKMLQVLIGASLISYAIYYILLELYGYGFGASTGGYHYSFMSIIGFADLMLGSSLLGKAFFEKYTALIIYYIAGFYVFSILLIFTGNILLKFKDRLKNSDKFFITLCIYVLANVLVVAVARKSNGMDGALGQWYQAHLKFIPITIAYFLAVVDIKSNIINIGRYLLLIILVVFLYLGYVCEYKKGPYVRVWKNNIKASIPEHLLHPNRFLSSPSDPLLWDAKTVHDGLQILYENKLAYFMNGSLMSSAGLTNDGWVEKKSESYFDIICPSGTKSVIIEFDHINQNNLLLLPKTFNLSNKDGKYQIIYDFNNHIKIFRLNVSKFSTYEGANPMDLRKLLFHVRQIQCHGSNQ